MNAWINLEISTDRVLTADEQKTLRALHPGIINIHPILITDVNEVASTQNREGQKIDELFKDYYKHKMQIDISEELIKAFVEILNEEDGEVVTDETETA